MLSRLRAMLGWQHLDSEPPTRVVKIPVQFRGLATGQVVVVKRKLPVSILLLIWRQALNAKG